MVSPLRGVRVLLGTSRYRWILFGSGLGYLVLLLVTLQNISPGGRGFGVQTTEWSRMFERIGPVTFEPVMRITVPGLTFLVAPVNLLIAGALSTLIGLGVVVTRIALDDPDSPEIHPSTNPALSGLITLLAGAACLVPGATIVFKIPVPASFVPIFQILIPTSLGLLAATVLVTLHRLDS